MTTIALPTGLRPASFSLSLATNQRVNASPFGGSEQAVDLLNDRWMATMELPARTHAQAAAIEAWIASMRGQVNVAAIYHFARPVPRGTARGTILVNGAVAQGASSFAVDGISPSTGTLLAGDMLGVGSQLFQVAADVTASGGAATVSIVNRVRTAIADNASVTWSAPTVLCRLLNRPIVTLVPRLADRVVLEFGEVIS